MNATNNLIKSYTPESPFDEFLLQQQPKPHWHTFIEQLNALSPDALELAVQTVRRRLKENGVTYNLHDESNHQKRAWLLDVIPNILPEDAWAHVDAGMRQRARLLRFVLEDCYGEQRLIKEGFLPPEIIYAHRGYLLNAACVKPQLSLYAADLARGTDGRLWVVSDRTQVPSGMGFALENRTVIGSVFPQFFQAEKIARLSPFFRQLQTHLTSLSPRKNADANTVLLSPGPNSETYFEHAYLASYLGYTLVQGDDLTVRDGTVYLKTLEGLEQIDVIIRRVDDDYCDPLELRGDSRLGTPGLLEAVRRGNVVIANSIGSSLLENPGLMPFLPDIAQHVLGEALLLPAVATWWCGQEKERAFVLENLPTLVIKRVDRKNQSQTFFGDALSRTQRDALRAQIMAEPHLFVGQEVLEHATAPILTNAKLEPRHILLRSFAVAAEDDYMVMPGGLSRSSATQGNVMINNRAGGMSKDTWVLTREMQPYQSLWRAPETAANALHPSALASRSADNLFWTGRYAERTESVARLLRLIFELLTDRETGPQEDAVLKTLLVALSKLAQNPDGFTGEDAQETLRHPVPELLRFSTDKNYVGGVHFSLSNMLNAAFSVKSAWSNDSWRVLIATEDLWQAAAQDNASISSLKPSLNLLISSLMAFAGLNSESMSRSLGWRFLDMGRRLERANRITELVRHSLGATSDKNETNLILEKLLTVSENIITYRRNYRSHLDSAYALQLILFDETNPRALAFQLRRLEWHAGLLPLSSTRHPLSDVEKNILEARTLLRLADSYQLHEVDPKTKTRRKLLVFLSDMTRLLDAYAEALTQQYFSHTQVSHQLTENVSPQGRQ